MNDDIERELDFADGDDAREQLVSALAKDLTDYIENSWHRFCLRKDPSPRMWPASIRMTKTARAFEGVYEVMAATGSLHMHAVEGETYRATSNRYGAVSAVIDGKLLGVKPDEYEVVTWQDERPASEDFAKGGAE